jgi:hypothetical protein
MFNFMFKSFTGAVLDLLTWVVACYTLAAIGYIVWHIRRGGKNLPEKRVS